MKEKALREKASSVAAGNPFADQQRQGKHLSTPQASRNLVKPSSFLGGALSGAAFFNPGLGAALMAGSQALAKSGDSKKSESSPESKKSEGWFSGALNLGKRIAGNVAKAGQSIVSGKMDGGAIANTLSPLLLGASPAAALATSVVKGADALSDNSQQTQKDGGWFGNALKFGQKLGGMATSIAEKMPPPLLGMATPFNPVSLATSLVKGASQITQPKQEGGGWLDGVKSLGSNLFNGTKNLGSDLLNGVKNMGNSALNLGSKAVNGAKDFASKAAQTGGKLWNEFSEYAQKNPWEVAKTVGHGALDVLGFIPVVGAVADVVNAGWYAAEGNYAQAGMSLVSAIPGVGDALGGGAKAASWMGKALPTVAKLAPKLETAAHVLNSPLGKGITTAIPMVTTGATATVQAATGQGDQALQTLVSMGAPALGNKIGGPMRTIGAFTPAAFQAKQTVDVFNQWNSGAVGPDGKPVGAQDVFNSALNLTTATAGVKMQQRMQHTSEYGIPTRQSADLAPGEVKVTGYQHGMPVVRHGGGVSEADLKIHQDLARQTGVEWNPMRRATNALTGKKPEYQFGTKGYQFHHEAGKHQRMADATFSQAQELRQKGDMAGASQLERHGRSYLEASERYVTLAQNPSIKHQKGDGEIAANKKLTPEDQAQLDAKANPKASKSQPVSDGEAATVVGTGSQSAQSKQETEEGGVLSQKSQPSKQHKDSPEGQQTGAKQGNPSQYNRVYPSVTDRPRGMPIDLKQVQAKYGEHGVATVERTKQRAEEIINSGASRKSRGPVVSGITDPSTGKTYFGQNLTKKELSDPTFMTHFREQLHPLLKQRLDVYDQKLAAGEIKAEVQTDLDRAGIPGSHSEIRALDQALRAREASTGKPVTESDLPSFMLHNRSLNDPAGVPPRCSHCWHLTDGVTVIGND
jgi:hypothetical protein